MESDCIQAVLLAAWLTDVGFSVVQPADARAALKACDEDLFDLALLSTTGTRDDDHLRLAHQLRTRHLLPSLLLCGRRPTELLRSDYYYAGQPVLPKPYVRHQLFESLATFHLTT